MKKRRDICELPVMKSSCKTCPFKKMENGSWQDTQLANAVISRTLFTGQQICHGTEGPNREPNHRCRGAFDHNKEIYDRMGCGDLISEQVTTKEQLRVKFNEQQNFGK